MTVRNGGPDPAAGTTLTDTLPTGVTFGSATPSQGSCSGTGTVTAGDYGVVKLVLKPNQQGTLTNTATVLATSPDDPVPANNSTTLQTPVAG